MKLFCILIKVIKNTNDTISEEEFMTTPAMIDDFKAAGGMIMLAIGFRMIKVKMFPTADMIPAMILVMPVSWMWVEWIMPFVG